MRRSFYLLLVWIPLISLASTDGERTVINLNGTWQFEQTINAFPPSKFTRTIPVPGLVHLALPKTDDNYKFLNRATLVEAKEQHNLYNIDYTFTENLRVNRIYVGIAPDFWYDIADEYGLLFQNEWLSWQNQGWDEQIRKEYTEWVWTDVNHPSIVIWDAAFAPAGTFINLTDERYVRLSQPPTQVNTCV